MNLFPNVIDFKDLGRNKKSFQKRIENDSQFWDAVSPHFLSSDLEYSFDEKVNRGWIYAGVRVVGTFQVHTPPEVPQ